MTGTARGKEEEEEVRAVVWVRLSVMLESG